MEEQHWLELRCGNDSSFPISTPTPAPGHTPFWAQGYKALQDSGPETEWQDKGYAGGKGAGQSQRDQQDPSLLPLPRGNSQTWASVSLPLRPEAYDMSGPSLVSFPMT